MSLLGDKCARCGKRRTRQVYQGVPTCESCQQLIETKLEAARESPRSCPLDGERMEKEIVLNVIVDRCPSCRGVWLDGGELEALKGSIEAGLSQDLVRAMVYPF
jgi:hypothetical protein